MYHVTAYGSSYFFVSICGSVVIYCRLYKKTKQHSSCDLQIACVVISEPGC